ncbi:MAG TPA: hypothetical protein VFD31_10645 [Thermoleophilaceae bacterium]|nr:hypothetical protein [Thermoleophilaceae bacterium]
MERKWLTVAVLAAGLVVVSLLVGLTADGGSSGPPLQLERATAVDGRPELLITVAEDVNRESNARGPVVDLKCRDARGGVVIEAQHEWPLLSDGSPPLPHVHQPASQIESGKIDRCEITGTKVELTGRLGIR